MEYPRDVADYFRELAEYWNMNPAHVVVCSEEYSVVVGWLYDHRIRNEFVGTYHGRYNAWLIPESRSRLLFQLAFT